MKKWMNSLVAGLLVLGLASPVWAASSSGKPSVGSSVTSSHSVPSTSVTGSSHSSTNVNSSGAQRPSNSVTNPTQTGGADTSGKTYSSGAQRPSSTVTQQPSPTTTPSQPVPGTTNAPTSKPKSGLGSFLGGMAVGGLLGSMFHPFGGGMHTMGSVGGFSFSGLIMDILVIAAIVWIFRRFRRRA